MPPCSTRRGRTAYLVGDYQDGRVGGGARAPLLDLVRAAPLTQCLACRHQQYEWVRFILCEIQPSHLCVIKVGQSLTKRGVDARDTQSEGDPLPGKRREREPRVVKSGLLSRGWRPLRLSSRRASWTNVIYLNSLPHCWTKLLGQTTTAFWTSGRPVGPAKQRMPGQPGVTLWRRSSSDPTHLAWSWCRLR